jgi:hypothetical protein
MLCHLEKSFRAFTVTGLVLALVPWVAQSASEPGPTPEQFDHLRALIKPHADEDKWSEIPWIANLWEARQRAAALGKPILLWEMDGNPLGCG